MGGQKTRNTVVMARFGQQLRHERTKQRLTQESLSMAADISTSQVARIEAGKLNTTLSTLLRISKALNIDPGDLFQPFRGECNPPA
jgi:transcriptional regulator with XRE-family HTH domain